MSKPVSHHLVSAGWQRNFATADRWLSIVKARSGELIPKRRAVKRNWVEDHWNSVFDPRTGEANVALEEAYSRIEGGVLRAIRTVGPGPVSPQQGGAIVNLAAIHLARSRSFREAQLRVYAEHMPTMIVNIGESPDAIERFHTQFGRPPEKGELAAMAADIAARRSATGEWNASGAINHHNGVVEMLRVRHIQVVEIDEALPGLAIGDIPVVHCDVNSGSFGYCDGLALGDADLIMMPLTRRTAVFFCAEPERNVRITSKAKLNELVALIVRAARTEVACHPDDGLYLQRICRNLPAVKRPTLPMRPRRFR